jgi:hypothetical protein
MLPLGVANTNVSLLASWKGSYPSFQILQTRDISVEHLLDNVDTE